MRQFVESLKFIRPLNGVIAVLSFIPATAICKGHIFLPIRESLALFLVVSFGYAVNDIHDQLTDKFNKPNRPLPSGRLSIGAARSTRNWMFILFFLAALTCKLPTLIVLLFLALFIYLYAYGISGILFLNNLWVAALCCAPFLMTPLVDGTNLPRFKLLLASVLMAGLFHLGREIIKDIEDEVGDKIAGRGTIPIVFGRKAAEWSAIIVLSVMIVISLVAYRFLNLSFLYFAVVLLAVDLPTIYILSRYVFRSNETSVRKASIGLKIIMLPALAALTIAGLN